MVFWLSITGLLIFYRNTSCSSPCGRIFIRWWWCPSHSRGTHYGQLLCSHCVKYGLGWETNKTQDDRSQFISVPSFSQNTSQKFGSSWLLHLRGTSTNQGAEDKPISVSWIHFLHYSNMPVDVIVNPAEADMSVCGLKGWHGLGHALTGFSPTESLVFSIGILGPACLLNIAHP